MHVFKGMSIQVIVPEVCLDNINEYQRSVVVTQGEYLRVHHSYNYYELTVVYRNKYYLRVDRSTLDRYFCVAEHFRKHDCMESYVKELEKCKTVEVVYGSPKKYKAGDLSRAGYITFNNGSHKIKLDRGLYSLWNVKPYIGKQLNKEGDMKTIPQFKFYCVAEEEANSSRRYFHSASDSEEDIKAAEKRATDYATELVEKGASGVAVLESKTLVRPKSNVVVTHF